LKNQFIQSLNIPFYHQMQAITVVPPISEGFGSLLQYALATYLLAEKNGLNYYHTPFTFEHCQQEGKTQEEWDLELNQAIIQLFVPRTVQGGEICNVCPEKFPLEFTIRNDPEKLNDFANSYWSRVNRQSYFDNSLVNVAIHARTFNSTDCDNSDFRELLSSGSISDNFILAMIDQLQNIFPRIKFHIYAKTRASVQHYENNPNVILHCESNLLDDLHHMIIADLLIMSKSSLSAIASYYRRNPSLIREYYNYATTPATIFIHDNMLTEFQINLLRGAVPAPSTPR
jgi:hypothetical protein